MTERLDGRAGAVRHVAIIASCVLAAGFHGGASAQFGRLNKRVDCDQAVYQLQNYAQQVQTIADTEYYTGIPYRCGWNQLCQQSQLQQLGYWYSAEGQRINAWYQQLVISCSTNVGSDGQPGEIYERGGREIDIGQIDEIEIDDEDRSVRIKIPDNPVGFTPRQD